MGVAVAQKSQICRSIWTHSGFWHSRKFNSTEPTQKYVQAVTMPLLFFFTVSGVYLFLNVSLKRTELTHLLYRLSRLAVSER